MRMFRVVTYPLAKPIIVYTVIGMALGAYGGFMWAFVVVPDERMWTLMVWLYQFSTDYAAHRMSLVMAALVVASIPTLLFFAFCQRIILRGIILPVMK
jgi:ABC-type glycerol-3-phosphate transport system permease component